jgi:hypothetical protein
MGTVHPRRVMLSVVAALTLGSCSFSGTAPAAECPTGDAVTCEVCGQEASWVRPPEEEQAATWHSGRYGGSYEELVEYLWTHDFMIAYGSASVEHDMLALSGLWTLEGTARSACRDGGRAEAVAELRTAEVWVLLHQVKELWRDGMSYTFVVEPVKQGVQFVQFARPCGQEPLTLHFVTAEGVEIQSIEESAYWAWPHPGSAADDEG